MILSFVICLGFLKEQGENLTVLTRELDGCLGGGRLGSGLGLCRLMLLPKGSFNGVPGTLG